MFDHELNREGLGWAPMAGRGKLVTGSAGGIKQEKNREQLSGARVVLGGGYALLQDAHIGVDALVIHLSARGRAIVDLITSAFFFFGIGVLLWKAALDAWFSLEIREVYSSVFSPPIYPFTILMVIGILLLLLQGVAKFIRDLITLTSTER